MAVGYGENHFSMSRGSFDYKQNNGNFTKLVKTDIKNDTGKVTLVFTEPKTGYLHYLEISFDNSTCFTVKYVNPSPVNTHINRYWLMLPAYENEHIYGCGETYSKFDLKGENVRIFVAEHQNAKRIGMKLIKEKFFGRHPEKVLPFNRYESYYAQPTYVSSERYFVHADINNYAEFDFRNADVTVLYTQEPPVIHIDSAESFPALSKKLASIIGHQHSLPSWVYDGAILAIQEGCERIDEKIKLCRDKGVKISGIWSQDWCGCRKTGFGYQVMWNWEWDKELYQDLDKKIIEWKNEGIRFLGYINPFMALEKELYQEATKKGYCVKNKEDKDYLVTITTFPAAMIDLTNPDAYEWYKNIIKENMIKLGLSGWMADFGEYLPMDSVLYSGEDPETIHNRWPAIWAKLNKEAIEECGMENEIFFFTRAGHTGTVSASDMMWTGDQHVDWSMDDGLPSVIPATLSLAMSGFGLTHSDVGGYTTVMHMTRSKELLMRWEEMNIFSPLFRSHEGNQPSRNVQVYDNEELIDHLARCSKMHAMLKPYLMECVSLNEAESLPVIRPLFYHYDENNAYTEKTEYLLGRDILVAPVIREKALQRTVYLPNDNWIELFTGKEYTGGTYNIDAPIGYPPVFIRKVSKHLDELLKLAEIK
ncbi:MAG: alpha-glucosidase [Lachnospiraceae bacterium]|nr:alpha-glucosidase [Lachnospiraceae bacterium]